MEMQRDFLLKPSPLRLIINQVAHAYGLQYSDLTGPSKKRKYAWPRQEAMWRCRRETGLSLPRIGLAFARNHETVLYGIRKHQERMGQTIG